jgi:1-phosphofructokinase/tagatose 6-phosphate kinase
VIVTVTMNAALDRTLTGPNLKLGHRHRASAGLTLAGGKGINVARALKALDVPVVATGLAGGRTGTRLIEELTGESILNDFVRIADESRTSTMVVDPTDGSSTEIYEWGPQVSRDELDMLLEKIAYLARGADLVVFAGSLPRGVEPDFYAEAIRELTRRRVRAALDTEGEPLRLGVEAEPWLVSPNQTEAESLVGQEFHDEEDFLMALGAIAELGARNVLIGHGSGAFALVREERRTARFQATIPSVDSVAPAGAGDAMLAGYLAARSAESSAPEALRAAVATGAAATLALGGGRFEDRDVARLATSVDVAAVEPVSAP